MAQTVQTLPRKVLRQAYNAWRKGTSKVVLERQLFGTTTGRGTFLTRQWANVLGIETRGFNRSQLDQHGRVSV